MDCPAPARWLREKLILFSPNCSMLRGVGGVFMLLLYACMVCVTMVLQHQNNKFRVSGVFAPAANGNALGGIILTHISSKGNKIKDSVIQEKRQLEGHTLFTTESNGIYCKCYYNLGKTRAVTVYCMREKAAV